MKNTPEQASSHFAPSEKASSSDIQNSYHALKNNPLIRQFQEAMPDLSMIINAQRQVVYANNNLIRFLDIEDSTLPLGDRMGDLLNCVNSNKQPSGCGTTRACRFCGVVNAVIESMNSANSVVKEARITAVTDENEIVSYDLRVKASPLSFEGQNYTIVCINDISDRKRRAVLETSYLNDMFGAASELSNMVSAIKKEELNNDNRSIVETAEKVNNELIIDLLGQKLLNKAEEGTLELKVELCNSTKVLKDLESYFKSQEVAKNKVLFIDPLSHSVKFITDPDLIRRVLINLITNAFEAVPQDAMIRVSVRLNDKFLKFTIFNPGEMSEEAKLQVFQRSFSTKASNRGLGTYTARLLAVKYLKGKISFISEKNGTTFFVELPLNPL